MFMAMEKKPQASFLQSDIFPEGAQYFERQAQQYREIMMRYQCAILEMKTKLEVLNNDFSVRYSRNPIEFVKTRLKEPRSIVEKMHRYGLELTIENMMEQVDDVAGVRVVCSYIDDIYQISKMLTCQDDIRLLEVRDYIQNPKPSGYRSYHMTVQIPVFFADHAMPIKVEIQIRTIAMDFWASLEHELHYKKELHDSDLIVQELRSCSDSIHELDCRMKEIRDKINRES